MKKWAVAYLWIGAILGLAMGTFTDDRGCPIGPGGAITLAVGWGVIIPAAALLGLSGSPQKRVCERLP